ncbi:MAG: hypothetical protein WAL25_08310 [Acidimicrobiia bacterium]
MKNAAGFFLLGLSLFLILSSLRTRVPGKRWGHFSAVAIVLGSGLLAAVAFTLGHRIAGLARSAFEGTLTPYRPWLGVVIVIGLAALGALIGEMLLVVFPERVANRMSAGRRRDRDWADLTSASLIVLIAAPALLVASQPLSTGTGPTMRQTVVGDFELPGPPMDFEAVGDDRGFISMATGEVYSVRLPDDPADPAQFEVALTNLAFPRGLAATDGTLYVGEVGMLTCESSFPSCMGGSPDEEMKIIDSSSGALVAYDINDDMALTNRREVITGIPIVNTEHAINDVEVGPDGAIYVSVGGVDHLWQVPEMIDDLQHPKADLLGTIVRYDPDSGDHTIHASGLRNVYGFDFDGTGQIIAVDNDGWTHLGRYPEGVLSIRGGDYFGFPWGPPAVTREGVAPIWQLRRPGTSGVEWLDHGPWAPGFLVGRLDNLSYLEMGQSEDSVFVVAADPAAVPVLELDGYVTFVEQFENGRLAVGASGIYGGGPSRLLIVEPA